MSTILDTIAEYARVRVANDSKQISFTDMMALAKTAGQGNGIAFENALRREGLRFICEVKKASPSKGIIAEEFPYLDIARSYEQAGADCVSCLTEPKWFLGSDDIFREIRASISIPMLRKDFVVDPYQIYQARVMGANAVLLICALLEPARLKEYKSLCDELGLAALVEAHDENEIASAVDAGARIIGVNNRNLKDFSVDITNSRRLRSLAPQDVLFVAESGIRTPQDIEALRQAGVDAVLIGETLMRAQDKKAMLDALRGGPAVC